MPRKKKKPAPLHDFREEVLDELLSNCEPSEITGEDGLLHSLVGALVSRAMKGEMSEHLGYDVGQAPPEDQENRHNGKGSKTLRSAHGPIHVDVPRDRDGSFAPKMVKKHEREFDGLDDKVLSMYARGMSVRDIKRHIAEIYVAKSATRRGVPHRLSRRVVRSSTRFVSYSERRAVCKDLRAIYSAVNEDTAKEELAAFESKWADKYPMIGKLWRQRWPELSPFLSFPKEMRRAIYTTNAIESLNSRIRKILKTRGHMPSEQAAMKLIYLALSNVKMSKNIYWSRAMAQFAIHFEDRMPH